MICKLAHGILALPLLLALGCGQGDAEKSPAGNDTAATETAGKDVAAETTGKDVAAPEATAEGRRVEIAVTAHGYEPATIPAKAGEKLLLVFSRDEGVVTCGTPLTVEGRPGQIDVPEGGSVTVPVTVPEGAKEIAFACTMDMHKGVITIN